jgi:hypothetical protein
MPCKSLRGKDGDSPLAATGPSPADFPLGSPASRAAARSRLDRMLKQAQTNGTPDAAVLTLETQRIYEPKYIRDQYGIVDPAADAIDEHFLAVGSNNGVLTLPAPTLVRRKWLPKTAAQYEALQSQADIMLFGGAAGSLKSATILMDAAREFRNTNFMGVVFRESYPNLQDLIKKAYGLYIGYPYFGEYNKTEKTWRFPTNAEELADPKNIEAVAHNQIQPVYQDGRCAQIMFRYMANDDDVYNYQSFQFSFIAFDESTHHSEFQIQYLLSRLRSTDHTLRLRMRLGTNPGGPGHDFHLKLFLGVCPHCHPNSDKARQPFKLYSDACWSDGSPLSTSGDNGVQQLKTTQFIPGNVGDHELFGEGNESYKANLRLQRPATAKALLAGCWSIFEGQYFNCWEENRGYVILNDGSRAIAQPDMRMVVSREELDIQYWFPHFVGSDYGFTVSAAANYLLVRTPRSEYFPNGRIYVLDEYVKQGILAIDLARELLHRWFLEERGPGSWVVPDKPRAIQMWALSPDAWSKTGVKGDQDVALNRADQMNAVMAPYRMGFIQANNDRQGGWQHIYRMLRSGELVICHDTCPLLVRALPSRIHDLDKEDDILKVKGDPLDDCMDALRCGVYTWTKEPRKPLDLQRAEVMQGLDPTSAMIAKLKLDSQQRKASAPIFIGPGAARRRVMYQRAHIKRR